MSSPNPESDDIAVPEVGTSSTTEEVIRWTFASSTQRLMAHEAGVLMGVDAEGVHQARVSVRRLRSASRTYRSMLDPGWRDELRRELGWLGVALGAVRDLDVLEGRVRGHAELLPAADGSGVPEVLDRLQVRRQTARARLLSAMEEPRYATLIDTLVAAAARPPVLADVADAKATTAMREAMQAPWAHLKKACDGLGPRSADAELHEARIRAKRVRYAAEALVPVFGRGARRFARRAGSLQEVLGRHQDAVMTMAWLHDETDDARAPVAFTAGMLAGIEATVRDEARLAWPGAWADLRRKRLRFWE